MLEAGTDPVELRRRLWGQPADRVLLLTRSAGSESVARAAAEGLPSLSVLDASGPGFEARLAAAVGARRVGYVPAGGVGPLSWPGAARGADAIAWPPVCRLPEENVALQPHPVAGWTASAALACRLLAGRPAGAVGAGAPWEIEGVRWLLPAAVEAERTPDAPGGPRPLGRRSRVLAVVTHFACEPWLAQCLDSLVAQTRPPDGIVVVDDASPAPPREIVRRFPGVTLLASATNVGPYRLLQEVIRATDHDAYLIQDADDWSTVDRLETLLDEAERTGAEMVGCQELRVVIGEGPGVSARAVCFPADVNRAMTTGPHHALLHPTSLIARALVVRLGGFATGLRFGADSEFLLRARYAGRVVNVPRFCYVRRLRPGSLTTSPATGRLSPARRRLRLALEERDRENARRVARGFGPRLEPLCVGPAVRLAHLEGPALSAQGPDGSGPSRRS